MYLFTFVFQQMKNFKIKKDYVPRSNRIKQQLQEDKKIPASLLLLNSKISKTQICPKCNQPIPIDEMEQHLKIELLDPKWKAQKDREQSKKRESNLIADRGNEMANNLAQFAQVRKDIFGEESGFEVEEKIRQQQKKAKLKETVVWDGHSSSVNATIQKVSMLPENSLQQQLAYLANKETNYIGPKPLHQSSVARDLLSKVAVSGASTTVLSKPDSSTSTAFNTSDAGKRQRVDDN
jgi:splicing factor 3A subunit 1